jgi:hypothetical protein
MALIYEGAQVVLAASDANDGHDGFLQSWAVSTPPEKSSETSWMIPTDTQSGYVKGTTTDGTVMPSLSAAGFKQIRRHCLLVVGPFGNDFLQHITYRFVRKNWFGNVNPVCGANTETSIDLPSSARLFRRNPSTSYRSRPTNSSCSPYGAG